MIIPLPHSQKYSFWLGKTKTKIKNRKTALNISYKWYLINCRTMLPKISRLTPFYYFSLWHFSPYNTPHGLLMFYIIVLVCLFPIGYKPHEGRGCCPLGSLMFPSTVQAHGRGTVNLHTVTMTSVPHWALQGWIQLVSHQGQESLNECRLPSSPIFLLQEFSPRLSSVPWTSLFTLNKFMWIWG